MLDAHGAISRAEGEELEAWLVADRRHMGAYARAQAGLIAMERAVIGGAASTVSNDEADMPTHSTRSRAWLAYFAGTAALAASLAVLAITAPLGQSLHSSEQAADRVATLKDGSTATLSEDAKILFATSDGVRKVTLLSGRATFHVAKDKAHPFVVRAGDVYAQATGTIYSVERAGHNGGRVDVSEGSVLVWAGEEREQAVLLKAGGSLSLDPGPRGNPLKRSSPTATLPAPEVAQMALNDVSIRSAVARFNRVNSRKIIIADAEIGNMHIVGLFRADDPEMFARAAASVADAEVVADEKSIVIEMK